MGSDFNDRLSGSNLGSNTISGGEGDDNLLGGRVGQDISNDVLIGGLGNDLLAGFGGADRYVFNAGDGSDLLNTFSQAELDQIDLNSFGLTGFTDSRLNIQVVSGDSKVSVDAELLVMVVGVTSLVSGDFVF